MIRDAYEKFFDYFPISPDDFFDFGIRELIHIPIHEASIEWQDLRRRVESSGTVVVRGSGRNGVNNDRLLGFCKSTFGHSGFEIDRTNNAAPAQLLQRLTGYSKTSKVGCQPIGNYQVSHVFGRTKNPYAFTAPWNVVYIPKIIDPFTGHEAPGELSQQFQKRFTSHVYEIFKPLIDDYNEVVTSSRFVNRIEDYIESLDPQEKFAKTLRDQFLPITEVA
jgi:hypothetical protein